MFKWFKKQEFQNNIEYISILKTALQNYNFVRGKKYDGLEYTQKNKIIHIGPLNREDGRYIRMLFLNKLKRSRKFIAGFKLNLDSKNYEERKIMNEIVELYNIKYVQAAPKSKDQSKKIIRLAKELKIV